jgi:hypothetical protein
VGIEAILTTTNEQRMNTARVGILRITEVMADHSNAAAGL